MALIGDIRVALGLDSGKFDRGIRRANQGFNTLERNARSTESAFGGLQRSFGSLGGILGGLSIGLVARDFFRTAEAMSQARLQLRAVFGEVDKADQAFERIRKFAIALPLTTEDVVKAFVTLQSTGVPAADAVTESLSKVAIAMGRQVRDVALAFISLETETLRRLGVSLDRTGDQAIISSAKMRVATDDTANAIRRGLLQVFEATFPNAIELASDEFVTKINVMKSSWQEFQLSVLQTGITDVLSGIFESATRVSDRFRTMAADIAEIQKQGGGFSPIASSFELVEKVFVAGIEVIFAGLKQLGRLIAAVAAASFEAIRLNFTGASAIIDAFVTDADKDFEKLITRIDELFGGSAKAAEKLGSMGKSALDQFGAGAEGTGKKAKEAQKAFEGFLDSIQSDIDKVRVEMEGQLFGEAAAEIKAAEIAFENLQKKFGSALPPDALAKFKELLGTLQAIKEASKIQALTLEQEFGFADIEDREAQEARNQLIEQEAARRIELKGIISELEKEVSLEVLSESARRIEAARRELDERLKLIEEWRQGAVDAAVGSEGVAAVNQRAADLSALAWESATEKMKGDTDEMTKFFERAIEGIQDAVAGGIFDLLQGNVKSWEDWGRNIKRVIDQVVSQFLAAQLNVALFGAKAGTGGIGAGGGLLGGLFGKVFGFFGGLFGGGGGVNFDADFGEGLQHGGFAGAGKAFIVGETGPELFLPDVSGQILSNFDSMNLLGGMSAAVPSFQEGGIVGITQAPTREISDLGPSERLIAAHVGEQIVPAGEVPRDRTTIIMNISTPDANSFRRSQLQITSEMETAIARGRRRRGGGS